MRIDMMEVGGAAVLAGAINGQKGFARLVERVGPEPAAPTPLFLDFAAVDVASASYLRESVISFRDYIRKTKPRYYPVVANAKDAVKDDLRELTKAGRDVVMTCRLDRRGRISNPAPLGVLEPKQQMTFDLVRKYGETDATQLMEEYGKSEDTKSTTAWNNRLAGLANLGLVIVESHGRVKRYRPLFKGV
jgi:hypothetical protein